MHSATEATQFGGAWTKEKLECLANYLKEYTKIFHRNSAARYFTTVYVDAFAGTGHVRTTKQQRTYVSLFGKDATQDTQEYLKGSALIALETDPKFDRYLFIERDSARCAELQCLLEQFPDRAKDIRIENAEANEFLPKWFGETNWHKTRAVMFIDPYATQVKWKLIEEIAATKAIDLWLLFPYMAFNRLLTRGGKPRQTWAKRLTEICGTSAWETELYSTQEVQTLFGPTEQSTKEASAERIGNFVVRRLRDAGFAEVAEKPLTLRNSKAPIFMLFFAAGNPKGAPIAVRIANWIIGKKLGR